MVCISCIDQHKAACKRRGQQHACMFCLNPTSYVEFAEVQCSLILLQAQNNSKRQLEQEYNDKLQRNVDFSFRTDNAIRSIIEIGSGFTSSSANTCPPISVEDVGATATGYRNVGAATDIKKAVSKKRKLAESSLFEANQCRDKAYEYMEKFKKCATEAARYECEAMHLRLADLKRSSALE